MITYQYQILRYIHDRFTGEFVNIGIVLFEPKSKSLKVKFLNKFSRISQFFTEINGHALVKILKELENNILHYTENLDNVVSLRAITSNFLSPDDSSLVFTDEIGGRDIHLDPAFEYLYEQLINKYLDDGTETYNTDKKVWKDIYKDYFDKYNITPKLEKHTVKTNTDTIDFSKSWKNGQWNCYESIALNLKGIDNLKNKVYRWSGILNELSTTDEPLNVFLLADYPSHHQNLVGFIEEKLKDKQIGNVSFTIVLEDGAEEFVQNVARSMKDAYSY